MLSNCITFFNKITFASSEKLFIYHSNIEFGIFYLSLTIFTLKFYNTIDSAIDLQKYFKILRAINFDLHRHLTDRFIDKHSKSENMLNSTNTK
jgi:hypothetical protein